MPSFWTRFRAGVDPIARGFNAYTAYPLSCEEHVGTLSLSVEDVRQYLQQNAYEPQYLSAAKRHPDDGALHDLSYRRVPTSFPKAAVGTRLTEWRPNQLQYHVHVFDRGDTTDLYSHLELRPDFFRPRINPRRLQEHYRPTPGETYLRGVTEFDV